LSSPEQIYTNPAAPYLNSLITPGNANAAQVSYATRYFNSGIGVHPSEPNYVWQEAATDFGFDADSDPTTATNSLGVTNFYTAPHFTAQLNAAGIPWNNYQENLQLTTGPQHSSRAPAAVSSIPITAPASITTRPSTTPWHFSPTPITRTSMSWASCSPT
jgi:hypothetical protein